MRLCDWRFRAILCDRQVLDYATAYFQLGPIERRIYEVARSTYENDGKDGGKWEALKIDLATFRLQIGYQNPLLNFRAALRQIAGIEIIPDYDIALVETAPETGVDADEPGPARRRRRASPVRVVITRRVGVPETPDAATESVASESAATASDAA